MGFSKVYSILIGKKPSYSATIAYTYSLPCPSDVATSNNLNC